MLASKPRRHRRRRGAGLIVVLILAGVTATCLLANIVAIARLRSHLSRVEAQHKARLAAPAK
ncbi:MAG: hypothetical protein FJ290_17710 [Planctomycetes bacterium]|nr:hypothetical protein [Planctomycetota bacterium]